MEGTNCTLNNWGRFLTRFRYLMLLMVFSSIFISTKVSAQQVIDGNPEDWCNFGSHFQDAFGNGVLDSSFTEGSKDFKFALENRWTVSQTKAKSDIANGGASLVSSVRYYDANNQLITTAPGNYLVFAGDRTSNNGDAQIGFWFYINGTAPAVVNGQNTFSPEHAVGDLLVLADFTGGGRTGTVSVYRWIGGGAVTAGQTVVPNSDGNLETTNITGVVAENNLSTYPVPCGWDFIRVGGNIREYQTNEFYEGFIDLGQLGQGAQICLSTVLLETRSSQSITASLDDFIGGPLAGAPTVSIAAPLPRCSNGPCVTLTATASGVGTITYFWTGPNGPIESNTASICVTAAGSYSVYITNGQGCPSAIATTTVVVNLNPAAPTVAVAQPTCTVATGQITVTSSTVGMLFSLNGGAYAAYPAGGWTVAAGSNNTVSQQNTAGCNSPTAPANVNAQPPSPVAPTVAVAQPTCTVATGQITVTSSTAGMLFSLNGGAYAAYPAGGWTVAAGSNNTVSQQNTAGCNSPTAPANVNAQPPSPVAPTVAVAQPTCTVATGQITVTSSTAGMLFSLNGGAYAAYPAGGWTVAAGSNNTVSQQNTAGCNSPTAPANVNAQPPSPVAPTVAVAQPTCTVATGQITVTSSTAGMLFSLNGGAYAAYPAGGWTVAAGSNNTVSQQNTAGCNSPTAPANVNAQPPSPVAPTVAVAQPTCTVATGQITVTSSTAGMLFSLNGGAYAAYPAGGWTVAAGSNNTVSQQNTAGCNSPTAPANVNAQPPSPVAPTVAVAQPTCTVATGQITVTSSTAGMLFSLNGGAYAAYPAGGWTVAAGSNNTVSQQNTAGCNSTTAPANVNAQPPSPVAPTVAVAQPTCTVATGQITVTSSTAGMLFSLNGGAYAAYPAGGWTVAAGSNNTVSQQNTAGCNSPTAPANVNAQPPSPVAPTVAVAQPTCTVATGQITVTSLTAGMLFSLNGGAYAAYPAGGWTVAAGSNNTVSQQNTAGCNSPTAPANVNAQPPSPVAPTVAVAQPTCTVATGQITITSSTAGMLFSLNGGAYAAYPAGGWTVAAGSNNTVSQQNTAGCNSPTAPANANALPVCSGPICTYTQGYYGNKNGNSCDADGTSGIPMIYQSPVALMTQLLSTSLTVGVGDRSITIPPGAAGASRVNSVMPGGSSARELTNAVPCSIVDACFNAYLTNQGRINNVLLSQTITLSLNLRISSSLPGFVLQAGVMATVRAQGGCGGTVPEPRACVYDPITHLLVSDNYRYRTISGAVVAAIDGPKTVAGLLDLANAALANVDGESGTENDVSLSAINSAVDAINNAFDQCRIFVGWDVEPCSPTDPAFIADAIGSIQKSGVLSADESQVKDLKVGTFPNPFTDQVNLTIKSPVSGLATIEFFNSIGVRVFATTRYLTANKESKVNLQSLGGSSALHYKVSVGSYKASGIALRIK